jgi:hypothetical protein
MVTAATPPGLSDDAIIDLLSLIKGADSVELKLMVLESTHRSAVAALDLEPLEAQIRQIFFLDTPDLALSKAGVVVRARSVQRKGDDSVVKLRPVVPDDLPPELRRSPSFVVEVDAMPGGYVCSAALRRLADPRALDEVPALGGLPGSGRGARLPGSARQRPGRRAGNQDPKGPRVLLQRAACGSVRLTARAEPRARAGRRP